MLSNSYNTVKTNKFWTATNAEPNEIGITNS